MEEIKPCPILEFSDNQLVNVRKSFGYDDTEKLKQDIDQFQDWISKQPHFKLKEFGHGLEDNGLRGSGGGASSGAVGYVPGGVGQIARYWSGVELSAPKEWNSLPASVFPNAFNSNLFKVRANRLLLDRDFLERYLIYSKGSIERAKQRFDKLCTFTSLMPEFLQNYDIKNEFKPLFNICNTCVLPKPSADNYRVVITTLTGVDDNKFELVSYYRYLIVLGHYMLQNDYCNGYELVGDSSNITMGTVKKLNPVIIHKALTLIAEALGQRMKKIHLISGSKFFDTILLVFKQALSAKLAQRLVIHNSVESLYDHIPRENLPKDLGGNEKTMKELSELNFKELSTDDHIAKVKNMEKASTDESSRQSGKFNDEYSGMPGSFKTLCVD